MMARPELWTLLALWCTLADFGAALGEAEEQGPDEAVVGKESYPILLRQKRDWIWNSLYVEEEKPAPVPYKIGQLKSTLRMDVKKFSIDGEGANTVFTVDNKGDLFVTRSLDREEKHVYHLSAKMYDGNNRLVEDSGGFEVIVNDINDNMPVFPKGLNGSVTERSPVGTEIVVVKATDADDPSTANGELRYSLVRGGDGKFQINEVTGMLSCSQGDLDRESVGQYVLVVRAQDMRGKPSGSTATTSVTVEVKDINDNIASFITNHFEETVPENHKMNEKITILKLEDRDEPRNKVPRISIAGDYTRMFNVEINSEKDGNLMLRQPLDYETMPVHTFTVEVREELAVRTPENSRIAITTATVTIKVSDVDEPPVFSQSSYTFTVLEERIVQNIGSVMATDPDKAKNIIRYSILSQDCPFSINPRTGVLSTVRPLDRELEATHMFQVKAQEDGSGLETFVKVDIIVQDINDNKPELVAEDIFVCENDRANMVLGTLRATDKDEQPAMFSFSLASPSSNFTIRDHGNNSADVLVKQGPFSLDDSRDYSVTVRVGDGGRPLLTSVTQVAIKACRCDHRRVPTQCKAAARRMGVSVHALIAILLCILTILVIVILFVMRKRYQKEHLSSLKHSGEIHEQLVTYDEEGGGEMDTNGYDVSILTSACNDGSLLRHPENHPHPSLYAMVQKQHHHQPNACKGDMAAMIEDKKFEADHDRDGFPYDTLHIYGYEGPESLAESLSSLDSSSSGSNLDYDFLNDWGPRFRTLAELYGVNGAHEYYHQY
ncbi:cadherin-5 [Eucyclogobius newberryi]|uniref:cadherin-5 n=1 Tax=Eucyclogobius newberryi TaxID=166745 RepID=UPI003B5AAC2E